MAMRVEARLLHAIVLGLLCVAANMAGTATASAAAMEATSGVESLPHGCGAVADAVQAELGAGERTETTTVSVRFD